MEPDVSPNFESNERSQWLPLIRAAEAAGEADVRAIVDRLARLAAAGHLGQALTREAGESMNTRASGSATNGSVAVQMSSHRLHTEVRR